MTNRKEEQGQAAIEQIKKEAGENAQIEWFPCDMGNLNEIKQVFEDFKKKEDRLDLVRLLAIFPKMAQLILATAYPLSRYKRQPIRRNTR